MVVRQRGGALRMLLIALVLVFIAGAGFALYLRGPGPTDFAAGPRVDLTAYKEANPTSVQIGRAHV